MGNLAAQAFALVRARALQGQGRGGGRDEPARRKRKLPIYGKVYAARALAASVGAKDPAVVKVVDELATLANAATKTDALINEPDEKDHDYYMSSDTRTTSAVLLGLVELDPKNAAIKPLVQRADEAAPRDAVLGHARELLLAARADDVREDGRRHAAVGRDPARAARTSCPATLAGKQKLRVVTAPLTADARAVDHAEGRGRVQRRGALSRAARDDQGRGARHRAVARVRRRGRQAEDDVPGRRCRGRQAARQGARRVDAPDGQRRAARRLRGAQHASSRRSAAPASSRASRSGGASTARCTTIASTSRRSTSTTARSTTRTRSARSRSASSRGRRRPRS